MSVCTVFIWFVFYSITGWVFESAYCTINERHWENRGFLYGPVCPIYGIGTALMMVLRYLTLKNGYDMPWYVVFLISFFGSAILEYSTHWALEKLFHAYWWDYSNMPLNLNGRICLPASLFFGIGGLGVVYILYEPSLVLSEHIHPLLFELMALVSASFIAADGAITVSALASFAHAASAINRSVNEHMELFVSGAVEKGEAAAQGFQVRRENAVASISNKVDTIKGTGSAMSESLQARGTAAADAFSRERERFAENMRDSFLGDMGHAARLAMRRVRGYFPSRRSDTSNDSEQLDVMLKEVRNKHWAND